MRALGTPDDGPPRTLLVRGGSSSVGMAALSLARDRNLATIATTRNPAKAALLAERGAGQVIIDISPDAYKGLAVDYVYQANLDRLFTLDQIAEAHRYMEANQAAGKVVVQPS